MRGIRILWMAALAVLVGAPLLAQASGRIEGTLSRPNGRGLGGVSVVVNEIGAVTVTGNDGTFRFDGVPVGSYTLSLTLGDNVDTVNVEVPADGAAEVTKTLDWDTSFAETITVFSASRRRERIVEAPAAVTVITEEQIAREATHGQLPKLLEFTPGAEVTQSGLYDFNFNSRGFNSSLNRRILTLIDGRDPSVTFLGSQEWTSLTVPLDALESVELVRGPGSALYGADAFNGVVNITTKAPRDGQGGRLKLSGGELSTARIDFSYAGALGNEWYARATAGYLESEEYSRSRIDLNRNGRLDFPTEVEYPGLDPEVVPLPRDENEAVWSNLRVDKYLGNGSKTLSFEAGYSDFEAGGVAITGIGRVQATESQRPYFRFNFNTEHWNVLAYRNEREADDTRSLRSGQPLYLDSDKSLIEVQGNVGFNDGKGRLVGGVNYSEENFDSINPQGNQTLVFEPIEADYEGVFGQLDYALTDKLKGVVSLRWDDSSLHDSQVSPRAALVYSITPEHSVRVQYGEAFQSPNYSEFFLQVQVAGNTPAFAGLEAGFCAPFGVQCGFASVPVLALGNPDLEVEEVKSFEVGYSGIIGKRAYVTIDYYNSQIENFITDLIPAANPTLGILNPAFGPYVAPSALPDPVRAQLEATVHALAPTVTNNPVNGLAILKGATYTNFGEVDTQGIEFGLNANLTNSWLLNATYTWFDFDVKQQLQPDQLLPNTPDYQYALGISYIQQSYDVALKYRHVDGFDWAAGVFRGSIPSYDVVDLNATYRVNDWLEFGLSVSNLLNDEHYEIFAGDILERRALGHVAFSW